MTRVTRQTPAGRAYLDLQNRARRERRGTQELLTLYVVERWLARLANSASTDQFVLKGGMLLAAFDARRPTADADALARHMANDEATVLARVVEIAQLQDAEDGVEFRTETTTARTIRDEALYAGVRVAMDARIATATVKFRIDVNFGDPITPAHNGSPCRRCDQTPRRSASSATRSRPSWRRRSHQPSRSARPTPGSATTPTSTRSPADTTSPTRRHATRSSPQPNSDRPPWFRCRRRSTTWSSFANAHTPPIAPRSAPTARTYRNASATSSLRSPPSPTLWSIRSETTPPGTPPTAAGSHDAR